MNLKSWPFELLDGVKPCGGGPGGGPGHPG